MLPVYSPSQTLSWAECPMKRRLSKQGWLPKVADNRLLGCLFGAAVARGLAAWRSLEDSPSSRAGDSLAAAHALLTTEYQQYQQVGVVFEDTALGDITQDVTTLLTKYPEHDPLGSFTILDGGVELDLGEDYGHARVDVLAKDAFGNHAIIDDKAKRRLEARWVPNETARYEHDWKMNHYCWAVSEKLGVPVTHYYINLIVLAPRFSVTLYPYAAYGGQTRDWWEASARRYWGQMAREDVLGDDYTPSMAVSHRTPFGWCPYKDACLTYRLDPALMATGYARVETKETHASAV